MEREGVAREAKCALDCCRRDLEANVFDLQLREQEKLLFKSYSDSILAEESFFRQKARVQWLKSGDRNLSYFFKVMTKRRNINKIDSNSRSDGTIATSDSDIKNEATTFF
ncbi:hypothetical protein TB2_033642 [Malus domestica]